MATPTAGWGQAPDGHWYPPPPSGPAASWRPDPHGRFPWRWWDGQRWTAQVSDGSATLEDPPPGWGQGTDGRWYPPPPSGSPSAGIARAALAAGILSLVCSFVLGLGAILGVLAVTLGSVGLSKADKTDVGWRMSIAGLVLGIVGAFASMIFTGAAME